MRKTTSLLSACLLVLLLFRAAPLMASVFEIRPIFDDPSEVTEKMILTVLNEDGPFTFVYNVGKTNLLELADVKEATPTADRDTGWPAVRIVFTDAGREKFAKVKRENVDKRVAVVIEGRLFEAPIIRSEFPDGTIEIKGDLHFKEQTAKDLAAKINGAVKKQGS